MTPSNVIAEYVMLFLVAIFALWLFGLFVRVIAALFNWWAVSKLSNVTLLTSFHEEARREYIHDKTHEKAEEDFAGFLQNKKVSKKSLIAGHVKTIFDAGIKGTQLEIGSLLNYTNHRLFGGNAFLKNILGIFIIVGLLGTLFGLADSLAQLSPMFSANADIGQLKGSATIALKDLLGSLKSAFAPSIMGVMFTIVGVFLYGMYISFACNPLKAGLEHATINVWIPQLYPTISHVKEIAKLADSIQNEGGGFNKNLQSANTLLTSLGSATTQLKDSAEFFNDSFCNRMDTFSKTFEQIAFDQKFFQNNIQGNVKGLYEQILKGAETTREHLSGQLRVQQGEIHDIVKVINGYEQAFLELRQRLDSHMLDFIREAKAATTSVSNSNMEITKQNTEALTKGLKEVKTALERMSTPIEGATDKLGRTLENFSKQIDKIIGELQRDIAKQNENYGKQLDEGKRLGEKIETLFTQVNTDNAKKSTQTDDLVKQVRTLNTTVGNLSQIVVNFSNNSSTIGETVQGISTLVAVIERSVDNLGKQTDKMLQLHQPGSDGKSLAEQIPRLTESLNTLSKLMGAVIASGSSAGGKSIIDVLFKKK
ncbi:membrane protein [Candidatus Magnetobacterium bavaricum]|uniref:Membrane protein n=1 Tax=Candidatus Magnetobacterium bavaricum TaxID=29290 RepID=A0A0F3H2D9_9BACT|nr:membrane protein [Candidatus Magnetobacterium bavaricum]